MVTVKGYTKTANGQTITVSPHVRGDKQSNRIKDKAPNRTPEQMAALRAKFITPNLST